MHRTFSKLAIGGAAFVVLVGLSILTTGRPAPQNPVGVPDDWTHHHLIFSNPGTAVEALAEGRLEQWYRTLNDPRYMMQQMKRNPAQRALGPAPDFATLAARLSAPLSDLSIFRLPIRGRSPQQPQPLKKDWSVNMGGVAASQTGTFTASSGTGNVVVNGTTLAASAGTATTGSISIASTFCFTTGEGVDVNGTTFTTNATQGTGTMTVTTNPTATKTVQIGSGGTTYTFETSVSTTANQVLIGTSAQKTAENLEAAINLVPGECSNSPTACYGSSTVKNTLVSAGAPSSGAITLTALCADNAGVTLTGSTGYVTVVNVAAASTAGTNSASGLTFALNTSGSTTTPASRGTTATNLYNVITGNATTSALFATVTNPSNAVDLTPPTGSVSNGYTLTLTNPAPSGVTLVGFSGTAGTTSGTTFSTSTDSTTQSTNLDNEAAALASAINTNVLAVTASSAGAVVTVTDKSLGSGGDSITTTDTLAGFSWNGATLANGAQATVGQGQYPAKYNFLTSGASCSDYVVYNTGLAGSSTQASIVAYNNLYSGTCTSVPSVYWAYNTGGTAALSPIIGPEGDQVAFIQTSGSVASLVLLRMTNSGGTVGSPAAITSVANGSYYGCSAPCYTTFALNGNPDDSNSPPFYDYWHDTIYVGDDSGKLHKFNPVFSAAPAEVLTSSAPWASVSGNILTGPVYDGSTSVFVGDSGGYLYRVSSAAAVTPSAHLTATGSTGIVDAPLIDSTPATPLVYVFVGDPDSVIQFSATFASGNGGISETFGSSATTTTLYTGAFDNIHYTGTGTTGNLYVCGYHNTGTTPRLFQIAMNATFTGTVSTISTDPASSGTDTCSPISEFLDTSAATTLSAAITSTTATSISVASDTGFASGAYIQIDSEIMGCTTCTTTTFTVTRGQLGTTPATHSINAAVSNIHDWIYLSVTANGQGTGCTGACLYNYAVFTTPSNATAGLPVQGGASGTIIDNGSTSAGASQIYFSPIANTAATTLSSAMTSTATTASVASGTGFNNGDYIQIDSEMMLVSSGGGTGSLTVTRHQLSTSAAAHASGAAVNDTCGTTEASGGCAVQASQSAP